MNAFWIIDQLAQQGVEKFCIAPGSRNAPLTLAAADHPKVKTIVHLDERGLGFYALGIGKGSKKPAVVITTGGTGAVNLYPAIMEAFHSKTPLIILTADRPHELRECSSNQTTDQTKLFANSIRWQMDLTTDLDEKTTRSIAAQAVFHSLQNPQGPVHLNCPFREPFTIKNPPIPQGNKIDFSFPRLVSPPIQTKASKGVILLGAVSDPKPVLELGKRLKWPIFADLLSNARCTPTEEQIRHFDYIIRTSSHLKPDFILHIGERLISKYVLDFAKDAPITHVSPYPFLQDPSRRLCSRIQADIGSFAENFEAESDPNWLFLWQEKDREIEMILKERFDSSFKEAHVFQHLPSHLPLFLGNSMPIRDADHFYFPPSHPGFFCNRGLSGIDGNIATAAGIADGLSSPLIAFIGDQAALHDLNSFAFLKKSPVVLIISNNFGGGVFDYLPVSASPHLDTFFAASHSLNFEGAAKMFDLSYEKWDRTFKKLPSSGIVELITDRKENHRFQKEFLEACSHAFV